MFPRGCSNSAVFTQNRNTAGHTAMNTAAGHDCLLAAQKNPMNCFHSLYACNLFCDSAGMPFTFWRFLEVLVHPRSRSRICPNASPLLGQDGPELILRQGPSQDASFCETFSRPIVPRVACCNIHFLGCLAILSIIQQNMMVPRILHEALKKPSHQPCSTNH